MIRIGKHVRNGGLLDRAGGFVDITVGDYTVIGHETFIIAHGPIRPYRKNPHVVIGDFVWIGAFSLVLPGVSIGKCCIIGAGSVVTKSVLSYTIAAGNPAKPIRMVTPFEILRTFQGMKEKRSTGTYKFSAKNITQDEYERLMLGYPGEYPQSIKEWR